MKHTVFLHDLANAFLREVSGEEQTNVLDELDAFHEVWKKTPMLRDLLLSSSSLSERLKILQGMGETRLTVTTRNVLSILLRENALSALTHFLDDVCRLRIEQGLGREVHVSVVESLREQDRTHLQKTLERVMNMPVTLTEQIAPEVMGGMRLTSGDWSWDGTIQHRLHCFIQHLRVS